MKHGWVFSTISNPIQDSQDSNPARKFDGNRGCGCAKNKCLNLNCQCFRAEQYCHPHCKCVNCQNREEFKDQRQEAVARAKIAREKIARYLLPKEERNLPVGSCNCERLVSIENSYKQNAHKLS